MNATQLKEIKETLFANPKWEEFIPLSVEIQRIHRMDIETELSAHPGVYCFFHGMMMEAKKEADIANQELERYWHDARMKELEGREASKLKTTEKILDSLIYRDSYYNSLKRVSIDATYLYNLLKALVSGLEHKKDCLVQLSSNRRAEAKTFS